MFGRRMCMQRPVQASVVCPQHHLEACADFLPRNSPTQRHSHNPTRTYLFYSAAPPSGKPRLYVYPTTFPELVRRSNFLSALLSPIHIETSDLPYMNRLTFNINEWAMLTLPVHRLVLLRRDLNAPVGVDKYYSKQLIVVYISPRPSAFNF